MEFVYEERRPPKLTRFVESIWFARGRIDYRRERIAPTGSTVAVVVLGDPIRLVAGDGPEFVARDGFLLGPHDRPVLIRDFRRHTGVTPSAYAKAQRAAFTPEQAAPGFTPEM